MDLKAADLARELGLTRGRISQLVSAGKLDGCFSGEGRQRRFDLKASAEALGKRLHPGQMLGNGAATREALKRVAAGGEAPAPSPQARRDGALAPDDPDRYEIARTQKAEEEARKLRRQNAEAEGTYVLAAEVDRQVARQIGQEVAEVETMLRTAARRVADELGVDYRETRRLLVETWRGHRAERSGTAAEAAAAASMTETEAAADI